MNAWVWLLGMGFAILTSRVNGKLLLDRLDQLESNLIGHEAPPAPPPSQSRGDREWIKMFLTPPQVINARLGDRIELECGALGSPGPEIQWLRGDRTISQVRKPQQMASTTGRAGLAKIKSRLVVDCVTRKHEGFYTCAATAGDQTLKAIPTLLLIDGIGQGDLEICSSGMRQPPRIISWSPTAMEVMGVDLQLPCVTVGSPAPSVYWMDPQNNILNGHRHQVSSNGALTISQLAWSDMGEYRCIAESAEGRDEVKTFVYPVMNQ